MTFRVILLTISSYESTEIMDNNGLILELSREIMKYAISVYQQRSELKIQ